MVEINLDPNHPLPPRIIKLAMIIQHLLLTTPREHWRKDWFDFAQQVLDDYSFNPDGTRKKR